MMTERKRLLKILNVPIYPHENGDPLEAVADYLLDNGVTIPVRCKDCKSYIAYSKSTSDLVEWGKCKLIDMDVDMPGNGYCCYGERIDNEITE